VGVQRFARSLGIELTPFGINTNAVVPPAGWGGRLSGDEVVGAR